MLDEASSPEVVVVDDDPDLVDLVVDVLADVGVTALGCTNASEAFWFIGRTHPKLIILDVQMPGVDGIQLFRQLREDPSLAETDVLFLTANPDLVSQALPDYTGRGATLIGKPFQVQELVDQITKVLARP
jgi:DNA-binding response OmpR family regulator